MRDILDACAGLPVRSLARGEELIAEGGPGGHLFVLRDGALAVRKGSLQLTVITAPGTCVGEISALLGRTSTATVEAAEPSTVYVFPDALEALQNHPEVTLAVARKLAERVHVITEYLADLRRQYGDAGSTLSLVGDVLDSLTRHQPAARPGSAREPDPPY